MSGSAWGEKETQFFYELTPDRVLDAVEASTGLRCTGRAMALNSMENRVYEIEIELEEKPRNPSDAFRIAKFYRPGRWSREQILEEHQYLADLTAAEIPAVPPEPFTDGETLHRLPDADIWYTVFRKIGGRSPDELDGEMLERVGRLLARMHNVGAAKQADQRVRIDPTTYAMGGLRYLVDQKVLPPEIEGPYKEVVETLCTLTDPWFSSTPYQRIHGDCHMGNLLFGRDGLFWVDFDDMVRGPVVQDMWLLIPGREQEDRLRLELMLDAYETMRPFDRSQLRLIEPLRALRFVHFAAWIAKRWQDPAFPRAFPHFGTSRYWSEQLFDLREQLQLIQQPQHGGEVPPYML